MQDNLNTNSVNKHGQTKAVKKINKRQKEQKTYSVNIQDRLMKAIEEEYEQDFIQHQ